MKQLLLLVSFVMSTFCLMAQDTLWTADFSSGLKGWSVNTISCGDNTGATFGNYTLASGTINGVDVSSSDIELRYSFINATEYSVEYEEGAGAGYSHGYSLYEISGDTLRSMISAADVTAGTSFSERSANGIVDWAVYTEADMPGGVAELFGANNPMITFSADGSEMTLTVSEETVLTFDKSNSCGGNWVWSPNGNVGYDIFGFAAGTTINSSTRANGSVQINALYQSSLGDAGYSPVQPYPVYITELISPVIDISAADRLLEHVWDAKECFLKRW